MWELTAVTIVAITLLALLTGPATLSGTRLEGRARPARRARFAFAAAVVLLGLFAVGAEGLALATRVRLDDSQAAASRGDAAAALDDAVGARSLEPWASSPYLQEALVEEQAGALIAAREAIGKAIDRDPEDWRLWLTRARIQTKLGNIDAAQRSLDRARELNPHSAAFEPG
jgi:tetratricopeptide (TPR) repeat protein